MNSFLKSLKDIFILSWINKYINPKSIKFKIPDDIVAHKYQPLQSTKYEYTYKNKKNIIYYIYN